MSIIWSGLTEEGVIVPVQVTAEGKVVAVGDGPEGEYLKLTGGNLTGDLTIATDKIKLNTDGSSVFAGTAETTNRFVCLRETTDDSLTFLLARNENKGGGSYHHVLTGEGYFINASSSGENASISLKMDGGATFAGDLTVAGYASGGSETGLSLRSLGMVNASRPQDQHPVWIGYRTGNSSPTSQIFADGSAEFAGDKCGFTSNGEIYFMSRNTRYKIVVSNGICQAEEYSVARQLKEKAEQFIAEKRETKPSGPSDPQPEVTPDNDNAS